MPFFGHFEIDIITALTEQLTAAFEQLESAPLTENNLTATPALQGVYHLFRSGVLVYVGKADNLRTRLSEHRFKITGRRNIEVTEMSFTCLTVHPNWTALAPESSLIAYYKGQPGLCEWNGNSFGPHDRGVRRLEGERHGYGEGRVSLQREGGWPHIGRGYRLLASGHAGRNARATPIRTQESFGQEETQTPAGVWA